MKKRHLLPVFALCATAMFSSCEKEVFNSQKAESTKDLNVPADFDWKTTQSKAYTVTSPVNTAVSFYTDESCSDEKLLVKNFPLTANEAKEVSLDIPTYLTDIYVQYPTANGMSTLKISTDEATTRGHRDIVLPEGTEGYTDEQAITHHYYPSGTRMGTILFEDLYPATGDYDFNDFVIGYNIDAFYTVGKKGSYNDGFIMKFQIRAIGGALSYRPAIRLKGFPMKNLKGADIDYSGTTHEGITLELLENRSDDQDVIFVINGTEKLRQGGFYNTNPDKINKDMPVVSCKVEKNNFKESNIATSYMLLAAALPQHFDFFIQNTNNNNEIHFRGFNPTDMSPQDSNTEFNSKKNLVWGFAIPELMAHPAEGIDIIDAYPSFKGWVKGEGNGNKNWYTKKPHDKVIDLN